MCEGPPVYGHNNAPGSIYNRSVPITDLLEHYGWNLYRGKYWTRPGKNTGVSGSVFDDRILWPFTNSTILAPDKPYDAFELQIHRKLLVETPIVSRILGGYRHGLVPFC